MVDDGGSGSENDGIAGVRGLVGWAGGVAERVGGERAARLPQVRQDGLTEGVLSTAPPDFSDASTFSTMAA